MRTDGRAQPPGRPGDPGPADAALLSATADGDRAAFEELHARHAPWLVVRLTRRCADAGLVDEVVQDTFVAVWRSATRWDGRGEVGDAPAGADLVEPTVEDAHLLLVGAPVATEAAA